MIYLIGEQLSKRTVFFKKAAQEYNVPVKVTSWDEIFKKSSFEELNGMTVKIDPPSYTITDLEKMHDSLLAYRNILKKINLCNCSFLNSPKAILDTLDKRYTKKVLMENKIHVTDMIADNISTVPQLLEIMKRKQVYSVFIKPVNYSGAAGIAALRINSAMRHIKLYTTCMPVGCKLYNTKRLYILEDEKQIRYILEKLLKLGTIAERWYPKDVFNGKNYDLRVVYQFGSVEYIVVRQSKGPFTNLHLNNQAVDIRELGLTDEDLYEIERVCDKAVSLFDGLNIAGIDIMFDKGSRKPRVIEINGQGDLIYQDIYSENKIYKKQVKMCADEENYI